MNQIQTHPMEKFLELFFQEFQNALLGGAPRDSIRFQIVEHQPEIVTVWLNGVAYQLEVTKVINLNHKPPSEESFGYLCTYTTLALQNLQVYLEELEFTVDPKTWTFELKAPKSHVHLGWQVRGIILISSFAPPPPESWRSQ